ncbi:Cu(I)/Ag(I) efflux system protein CusF [Variovorax sp. TBS-050B]|uniref:copper-binding protein n=1 Tax=Variovorax sp. TBS-050B TaxID=2940551 RepID=UPI0024738ACD|nr:copper-binding protein [Variovorax sp. TBS-050B]MDH6590368.1 Cu(I)/Ag(I) efflux system protein CusF [Variovorax sp. TBS-050B]
MAAKISFISRMALAAAMAAAGFSGAAVAQTAAPAANAPAAAAELADGEIRKIDKENRKLTIKHGPLKSLDMPSMTMVFGVRDETMLETLQAGDKVRFDAAKVDGKIVVTHIEPAR